MMRPAHPCLLLTLLLCLASAALPRLVRVGALFTEDQKVMGHNQLFSWLNKLLLIIFLVIQDSSTELAFKYAVYKINKDPTILANKTLTYDIQYVPREDSFRTTNKVCLELIPTHDNLNIFSRFVTK